MAVANNWTLLIQDEYKIDGESQEHPLEIPIHAPNFNLSRVWRTSSDNTNAPEGHPLLSEISLAKETDKASPKMYHACCAGIHLGKVVISGWTSLTDSQEPVMVITLTNTGISSISMSDMRENFTFAYTQVTWKYRDIDVTNKQVAQQENNWNRATNRTTSGKAPAPAA